MKTIKTVIAVVVALSSASAFATDCGCNGSSYDKKQDVKIGALQDRDAQLAADIHQVHINTLGKYSESWGLEDRANIGKLQADKLDKSVFTADQQRQDKALAATVTAQAGRDAGQDQHINAVQDAAQSANVKADGLAVRADGIEQRAQVTDDRSISNAVRLDGAEGAIRETNAQVAVTDSRSINNAVRLDGVESVNGQQEKMLGNHETRITQNSSDIVQLYSNGEYAQSRIDAANANIEANRAAQVASNKRIAANTQQLANHEQRLGQLESQTNSRFANMDKRIDEVRDRADAGVASVAAMANIPQVTEYQSFAVGAGVGSRHDQQALAVGFSARATSSMVVKASVSTDTTDSFTFGAGASIGW